MPLYIRISYRLLAKVVHHDVIFERHLTLICQVKMRGAPQNELITCLYRSSRSLCGGDNMLGGQPNANRTTVVATAVGRQEIVRLKIRL